MSLFFTSLSCIENNLLPNRQGNRLKHVQFSQGVPVWRMQHMGWPIQQMRDIYNLMETAPSHAEFTSTCCSSAHVLISPAHVSRFSAHVLNYPAHAELRCTCCLSANGLNIATCAQLIDRKPTQQRRED